LTELVYCVNDFAIWWTEVEANFWSIKAHVSADGQKLSLLRIEALRVRYEAVRMDYLAYKTSVSDLGFLADTLTPSSAQIAAVKDLYPSDKNRASAPWLKKWLSFLSTPDRQY
jgi:hypothetical protein